VVPALKGLNRLRSTLFEMSYGWNLIAGPKFILNRSIYLSIWPNMKAIHGRIKKIEQFNKKLNQTPDDVHRRWQRKCPFGHQHFERQTFSLKKNVQKKVKHLNQLFLNKYRTLVKILVSIILVWVSNMLWFSLLTYSV